ncbi:MAG: hypothetical protein LC105_10410 [Chitinophagales bacterium]|nr:hypothetical protein [Chitinophagales bacterium]MCZ2394260.1 hypothetical protein [Chitinophagales bacterium]
MNNKIKDTVKYNKELFIELTLFQFYKKWSVRWMTVGGVLCFFMLMAYLFSYNPFQFRQFPYFGLFYVLGVMLLPFFVKFFAYQKIKSSKLLKQDIQIEFSALGINIAYSDFEKLIFWNQLYQIVEHHKAWIFYGTAHSFFYFPKDLLSQDQNEQLKVWMKIGKQ